MNTQNIDFEKQVKHKLIDIDKGVSWLASEVTERTGLYCDTSYLAKIFNGERSPANIVSAIKEILELE